MGRRIGSSSTEYGICVGKAKLKQSNGNGRVCACVCVLLSLRLEELMHRHGTPNGHLGKAVARVAA